jgi:hypothetical protein
MGPEFISRTLRSAAIVLLIFAPFDLFYMGVWPTLAVISGGVWGILNLFFIMRLIRVTIRPEGVMPLPALGLALFKFPLMFVAGYFMLKVERFDPIYLVAGFTGILAILILRVLGRSLVESNNLPEDSKVHKAA